MPINTVDKPGTLTAPNKYTSPKSTELPTPAPPVAPSKAPRPPSPTKPVGEKPTPNPVAPKAAKPVRNTAAPKSAVPMTISMSNLQQMLRAETSAQRRFMQLNTDEQHAYVAAYNKSVFAK